MLKPIFKKQSVLLPAEIFLFKFLSSIIIAFLFWTVFSPGKFLVSHYFLDAFSSWDGGWYTHIAQSGYSYNDDATAFFPLYPILIRLIHSIFHCSWSFCAFFISNFSLFFFFIFLYRVIAYDQDKAIAKKTVWLYATFPAAMFLTAGYSESLNLLLITLYFYSLQKKQWYISLFMGALASLTHDLGVLLCFSSFFYWYKEIKILSGYQKILRFLSIGIIPSGLLLYMGYLWLIFGSPFEFMHAQLHWHRHIVIPIYNIIKSLVLLPYSDNNNHKFLVLVNCLSALLFLVLLIPLIKDKTIPLEQKIFYILTFFCSIISDTGNSAQSYARFMLILFPGFMLLGKLIENETAFTSMLLLFFSFETILLGMFVTGYWVT